MPSRWRYGLHGGLWSADLHRLAAQGKCVMKFEIKNRFNLSVIFECEAEWRYTDRRWTDWLWTDWRYRSALYRLSQSGLAEKEAK